MKKLIQAYPEMTLQTRGDAFFTLARSIVGQQISVKAAESIWNRTAALVDPFTPEQLLATDPEALRPCGLSARKVEYLRSLADHFHTGPLSTHDWENHDDETLIRELTEIRGIGRWTAEMFLMFHLMRPDVLPLDDIGLQRGVEKLYNNGEKMSRKEIAALAEKWRPYRSVATWYLWRSLDPVIVAY